MTDDLPDDSPPPCCPSCSVAYREHLGLDGTCAEMQRLRAQVEQYRTRDAAYEFAAKARIESAEREAEGLRAQVERLTANATAREGVMRREGDLLRASQRESDTLRAACSSALCMLVEGPDVLEPGQSAREAKAILAAALNPKEKR